MTAPPSPTITTGPSVALLNAAARLLPRERRRDALTLGAACLAAATMTKAPPDRHIARNRLRHLRAALRAGDASDALAAPYLALHDRYGLRLDMAELLVTTLLRDLEDPVIETWNGLIRYCHGSGGTVAVMLCPVLGADNAEILPFAIDLGIGARLIQIANAVRRDAIAGRVYLPAALLPRSLTVSALVEGSPSVVAAAHGAATKLLKRAAIHLHSAEAGLLALPIRSRATALIVIRHHEALSERISAATPKEWWRHPVKLSATGRFWRTGRALTSLATKASLIVGNTSPPDHVAILHKPLRGLPGVPRQ